MTHLPMLLGGALFFAVIVVLAVIAYALLQLIFEVVDMIVTFSCGIYCMVTAPRNMDMDDWIGMVSFFVFILVVVSFVLGGLQP